MGHAASGTLRVCQLISSFHPVVGGAERATLCLSQELIRRGCTVTVLTRRYPGLTAKEDIGGIRVVRAGIPSRSKFGALTYIVHVLFLLAARFRNFRLIHAQGTDAQLLAALFAKTLLGRRVVLTVHTDPHLSLRINGSGGGPRFHAVKKWADSIGVLGAHVAEALQSEGVRPDQIAVLPNGVDTGRFHQATEEARAALRAELDLSPEDLVGVFVGRLIPLKRVDLLIRAWSAGESKRGPLLIVGDGPERAGLEALAEEVSQSPGSVRFLGRVDVPERILKACDFFILPSQREGLSVALLEAMACGLVPIVSDLEPNTAVVEQGVTGFVFATDDQSDLERALVAATSSDVKGLGAAAVSHVKSRNSLEKIGETHMALYERLNAPDYDDGAPEGTA